MELWGDKTISLFDIWSFEHFFSGASIGRMLVHRWPQAKLWKCILLILAVAYAWEAVEWHLEMGYSGVDRVTYWFQGVEFWGNRVFSDPFLMVIGYLISTKYSQMTTFAKAFYPGMWALHILVFPHCMYLHEVL